MSGLPRARAPSTALLRYLRSQTDSVCCTSLCRLESPLRASSRRCLSSSTRRQYGHPPSYIDDLFARNREKCKALPAPKSYPSKASPNRNRHSSSDTSPIRYEKPSLWNRIFHRSRIREEKERQRKEQNGTLPDYSFSNGGTYEETSAQLFNLSRALSRNPSGAELKLRCTEFDKNGDVTLVAGEFKKTELIAKYGLLPRDLRKIDSSVLPHILVRPAAILINLLHLRVLIQSDRVLVFDAYGSTDSYTQSLFMYDLEGKLSQKQTNTLASSDQNSVSNTYMPYEFRALEAVLISVTSGLEAEFALVREPVTHILRELEEDIDREKLRHLLIHSKKLGTFEQKARLVRDALYELLESDEDLATMYLTERKRTGKPRPVQEHTEVEVLLESYHKICDEVVEISGNLISNIRNTEEVIKAILDANRNQLMLFEIKVSIATLGLAGGTLVAGFYGMNLENFIEETNWGFAAVTGFCTFFSAWLCVFCLRRLRNLQKVRMWGEATPDRYHPALHGRGMTARREAISGGPWNAANRGNWRSEALEALALGQERQRKLDARFGNLNAAAGAGPVLWPGMDGLGLHKLGSNASSASSSASASASAAAATTSQDVVDSNSDADDTLHQGVRKNAPVVTIRDDTFSGNIGGRK